MVRGKAFQCEITVSSGVNDKLLIKHNIEVWELEEVHKLGLEVGRSFVKIITARDMNRNQRKIYLKRKGG